MAVHVEHGECRLCGVRDQEIRMAGLPKDCTKEDLLIWRIVDDENAHANSCQPSAQGMRAITYIIAGADWSTGAWRGQVRGSACRLLVGPPYVPSRLSS